MGVALSGWEFVPIAEQAIRQTPGDDDLRLLLVRRLCELRLRTAAREHVDRLAARTREDTRPVETVRSADALPDDRVPIAELEAVCRRNVEALSARSCSSVNLRLHLAVWRARAAGTEWFRALNGNIVRRRRQALGEGDGGSGEWINLHDIRGGVAAQNQTRSTLAVPGMRSVAAPLVIEGIDPPWLFKRLCDDHPPEPEGYHAPIALVQADMLEFLDGLAQADLTAELIHPRLRLFLGPSAGERFREYLLGPEQMDLALPGAVITVPTTRVRATPSLTETIERSHTDQPERLKRLAARAREVYAGRDAAWYARRFGDQGSEPLRVLIPTSRYSTFVRHAAADLAGAFNALGHEGRVLMEPDDHSWLTPVGTARALAEFVPDLVVLINYTRKTYAGVMPAALPVVTWVQDAMPQLLDRATGEAMGPLDFTAGNVFHEHFEKFAYPRERSLPGAMVASPRKFHDGPVNPVLGARFTCDVAFVSHHSELPEALHRRRVEEAADAPEMARALEDLYPAILREVEDPLCGHLSERLRTLAVAAFRARGLGLDEGSLARLFGVYVLPIADRAFRHRTLEWAAEIARRRGWSLHIYGRGWEKHPTLGGFARGQIAHGEELRACYQCAKAHLQMTVCTVVHQRMIECALSGGLPICRLHADDLSTMSYLAAAGARTRAEPSACHIDLTRRIGSTVVGFPAAEHPEGVQFNEFLDRMGLAKDEFLWIAEGHVNRSDPRAGADEGPRENDLFWILGEPGEVMFTKPGQLEERLALAIGDPAWRDRARATLAQRAKEFLTHDAFARRLLAMLGTSRKGALADPDSAR